MRRHRRPKKVLFQPGPEYWEITCRTKGIDYSKMLIRLAELLPAGLTLYLEGTTTAPVIDAYLRDRPAQHTTEVPRGTIWPRPTVYHMPMTSENVTGLAALMDTVAEPEVCHHMHAYDGATPYIIWYDAFYKSYLYLRKDVPEDEVQRLCADFGSEYSSYS